MLHRLHVNGKALLITAAACVLAACGADQVAGIEGTGAPVASGVTSVGPISGFGSIIQGGVEYQTTGAQIQIDDQPATEAQLQVGDVVAIQGTVNPDGTTGVATNVSYAAELRGPVTAVDATAGTFTVLGQVVRITDDTLFDDSLQPASIDGIQVGAVIEVSGSPNSAGEIVASHVEPAAAGASLQVKGKVQSLNTTAQTFVINGLTVNYSSVVPTGTLTSTSTVLVRGAGVTNGILTATQVRVLGAPAFTANGNGRFDGLITSFTSNAAFSVGSQQITTDSTTVFDLGGATLGVDVPVRVRGTFTASGVLAASRVEVKAKDLSVIRGLVDAVSATNKTLTVMGIAITTGANTSLDDKSSQKVRFFSLADVRTGDYVEVRGVPGSGSSLVATLVERNKPDTQVLLQGLAGSLANPSFTILGVQVMTNGQTKFNGPGGAQQFFTDAVGQAVQVQGTFTGGVVVADRVQIKH
jgi:Domain of unknown function (DUF5666)